MTNKIKLTKEEALTYLKTHLQTTLKMDNLEVEIEIPPISNVLLKFKLKKFLYRSFLELFIQKTYTIHYKTFSPEKGPEAYHCSIPSDILDKLIQKYFFED